MADAVHPNLALVQRMYECFNKNDMDTIRREIFAPDLVWNLPGRHPLAGTKNGAEEVLAFFSQLVKGNIQVTLDPASDPNTGVDTFGESTVVEVHRGHGTTTGGMLPAMNRRSRSTPITAPTIISRTAGSKGCRSISAINIRWTTFLTRCTG